MIDPRQIQDATAAIEGICTDTLAALDAVTSGAGVKHKEAVKARLVAGLDAYAGNLRRVAEAGAAGHKKQFNLAKRLLLYSYDARLCAVLRASMKRDATMCLTKVQQRAEALDVFEPLREAVRVRWDDKAKGGYRPIVVPGLMRTAQCLMVRDMLSMMGIDSHVDFSRKGAGGERQLVKNICRDIDEHYHWWWTPDLKNCFGSITPGHFSWLPIDRRLLMNVMFLPKCAEIIMVKTKEAGKILSYLQPHSSDLSVDMTNTSLASLTVQIVRQGLCQGSVLSPLLARALVNRILETALPSLEIRRYSFSDDLNLGATTKGKLVAAKQAVTNMCLALPAGPIELHHAPIVHGEIGKLIILGYLLEPGNGCGGNAVHVKPWRPRTDRFKRNLLQRLRDAEEGADLFEVAETYRKAWFASQTAWTKVPLQSENVSRCITGSYVDDFLHGLPMGVTKLNKPKCKNMGHGPSMA